MSTSTSLSPTTELILVASEANLEKALVETKLAPEGVQSLRAAFAPFFTLFHSLALSAQNIPETSPKAAGAMRKELKKIRIAAEKTRKELKEDSLLRSRAVDGINNLLLYALTPIEKKMEDIENRELIEAEAKRQELRVSRGRELSVYTELPAIDLGQLPEDQYKVILLGAKTAHETKLADATRLEDERIATEKRLADERAEKEAKDKAERDKLAAENVRLAEEAKKAKEAKEAAEKKAADEKKAHDAEAAKEKSLRDAEALKQKQAQEAELKRLADIQAAKDAEAKKAEDARKAAQKVKDDAAQKERDDLAAKAKAAQDALDAQKAAEDKRKADEQAARDKAIADEKAEKAKAAKAPDRDKLAIFAAAIRSLPIPKLSGETGVALTKKLGEQTTKFAAWVDSEAGRL